VRDAGPDPVEYMLQVARTPSATVYKTHVLAELELSSEIVVVDVGCGPGTDLKAMAERTTPRGLAVGLDLDSRMLMAATASVPPATSLAVADAHRMPFTSASVDRLRTDRSLQHMRDPMRVLAEFARVLRPGGIAVIAEPDWATLVIDTARGDVSRRFVDYTCGEVVRNAHIGRQVARLGADAGLVTRNVVAFPAVLRDFVTADKIFGLTRNALAAVESEYLSSEEAKAWIADLSTGPILAAVTLFVTTLINPADRLP